MPATPEDLFQRLADLGIETTTTRHAPVFTVEENRALRGGIAEVSLALPFGYPRRRHRHAPRSRFAGPTPST